MNKSDKKMSGEEDFTRAYKIETEGITKREMLHTVEGEIKMITECLDAGGTGNDAADGILRRCLKRWEAIKSLITKYADLPDSLNKDYLMGYEQGKFDVIAEQERKRAESRPDPPADTLPLFIIHKALEAGRERVEQEINDSEAICTEKRWMYDDLELVNEAIGHVLHAIEMKELPANAPADEEVEELVRLNAWLDDRCAWCCVTEGRADKEPCFSCLHDMREIKRLLQTRQPKRVSRRKAIDVMTDIIDMHNDVTLNLSWEPFFEKLKELEIEVGDDRRRSR